MNHPILLAYNLNPTGPKCIKVKQLCVRLGIRFRFVEPREYGRPLLSLLTPGAAAPAFTGEPFSDEMLLFANFSGEQLDEFLRSYREAKLVPIALKAVLTPANSGWNSLQLHKELNREHAEMQRQVTARRN